MSTSYMSRIDTIAHDHAGRIDYEVAYSRMKSSWERIEEKAKRHSWDIFAFGTADEKVFLSEAMRLIENLYHGCDTSQPAVDCNQLIKKNKEYGESWCSRGGVGAFMMAARKWDRVVNQVATAGSLTAAIANDQRVDGILDDLGDLRCYLLLWVAWLQEREDVRLSTPVRHATPVQEIQQALATTEDIEF